MNLHVCMPKLPNLSSSTKMHCVEFWSIIAFQKSYNGTTFMIAYKQFLIIIVSLTEANDKVFTWLEPPLYKEYRWSNTIFICL